MSKCHSRNSWFGLASVAFGEPDAVAVKTKVFFAVVEVVFQFSAGAEFVVGCYRDIALVEEPVNVGAEKKAVIDSVFSFFGNRLDVGGF